MHRIACTSVSERKVFLVGHGTTVAVLIYQSCIIAGGVRLLMMRKVVSSQCAMTKQQMDGATAQQQQQMFDMLQLRSDELSAENGKLRMRMVRGDRQLPKQLHNDYRFSQVFSPQQNERMPSMRLSAATVTHQHVLQARGFRRGALKGSRAVSSGTCIISRQVGSRHPYDYYSRRNAWLRIVHAHANAHK